MSLTEIAKQVPVIRASGTNYEIGRAHGKYGRKQIEINLNNLKAGVERTTGHGWDACTRMAAAFIPVVKTMVPWYLDEIQGLADGGGFTFEDIFALNCRTELGQQFSHCLGANVEAALRLSGGCSVLGVNHTRTVEGTTIYGQNWDAPHSQDSTIVFIIAEQKDKPDIAWIGEAGLLCRMSGMNSAGIGLGGNSLFTNAPIDFEGLPLQFAYRYIMDQSKFPDAVAAAVNSRVASNINFMVCGAEGEMVNLEMEYKGYGMIYMKNGVICHANHYRHPKLPTPPYRETDRFPKDALRACRLESLTESLRGNAVTVRDIMDILSDHKANYPTSICQHAEDFATLTSTVCDLNKLEMYVAVGSPCKGYAKVRPFSPMQGD